MQRRLLELERRLDIQLIDWRLDGRAAARAVETAGRWAEAVWVLAQAEGPAKLDADDVARGLELARRPVFICGVHRSGTTLVRDLLDSHPDLNVLPAEGLFFTNLKRLIGRLKDEHALGVVGRIWLQRLVDHSSQPPFWLLGRSSADNSPYVSFARALMAWWRVAKDGMGAVVCRPLVCTMLAYAYSRAGGRIADGPARWAEKTPNNERFIGPLLADFPEAKIIHVIRDPNAVFESRKSMELQTFGIFGNGRTVLKDLARTYRVALARRDSGMGDRYLLIRYEDLIERPDAEIDRLAAFLQIQSLPILWCPTVGGIPIGSNSSFGAEKISSRILTARERAPRPGLDRADRDLVGSAVGRLANHFGYGIPPVTGWKARLRGLCLRV
jgi:hypothetical protein